MFNLIQNFLSDLLQRTVIKVSLIEINVIKNLLIRTFLKNYQIEMDDYPRKSHLDYKHFNDFFTREIDPSKRPIDDNHNSLISPVDGKIVEFGKLKKADCFKLKACITNYMDCSMAMKRLPRIMKTVHISVFILHPITITVYMHRSKAI